MEKHYQQFKHVSWLSFAVNSVLSLIKCLIGYFFHSQALLADGFHSLSDVLIDILVLVTGRVRYQTADHNHPYGHGRVETLATMLLAVMVMLAGVGIFAGSLWHFWHGANVPSKPGELALWVAAISVIANELLYQYMRYMGERLQSNLLLVGAWHNRMDAASSLLVLVSVALSLAGYSFFDMIGALLIGVLIIKMGWQFAWSSLRELIDTGLDRKTLAQIKKTIREVSGIYSLHQLRTRLIAGDIFLDVHVLVNPTISVSEGHYIGDRVEQALQQQFPSVKDVTVHVDSEEDDTNVLNEALPEREKITALLNEHCRGLPGSENKAFHLHYLYGDLTIELLLNGQWDALSLSEITQQYQQVILKAMKVKAVKVYFSVDQ